MILPYLPTKLHRPRLSPRLVPRPELVARLNLGLAHGNKLSLVVAPAGFGKTTLVNEWLQQLEGAPNRGALRQQIAWLSLDALDNELTRFFQYVVLAIQNIFPSVGADSLRLLQAPQLPPVTYLVTMLLSEWATLPEKCLLVLEDFHHITEPTIHQLLTHVLEQLPPQFHLVLISRTEPSVALARWRVRQQMTEIRAADLCFLQDETQNFLAQALGRTPAPEIITTLQDQTEGWVAGLQLATLALTNAMRSTHLTLDKELNFVRTFAQSDRHVMAYLVEEVLTQQPPVVQTFLLHTAILEHFCAPLAEMLLTDEVKAPTPHDMKQMLDLHKNHLAAPLTTAQAILTYLVQMNLFIAPLDAPGEWYRYHQLFRDLLRHHLRAHTSPTGLATLHRRASTWLANHGWIEEAIQHALAGGDELAAARLVAARRHALLNQEDWRALERWLALFPPMLVQRHAELLICQAWIFHFQFKLPAVAALLQAVPAQLGDPALTALDVQLLQIEIESLNGELLYWQNESQQSLAAMQHVLEQAPAEWIYVRGGALLYLGLAAHMIGQTAMGMQTLRTALKAQTQQAAPNILTALILYAFTIMHYLAGELLPMQQTAQDLLRVATQNNLGVTLGWTHYLLGLVAYDLNELETAARHFTMQIDQRYISHSLTTHNSWLLLAWLEQMQGRPDEAQRQVAALLDFHHERGDITFLPFVHSFQARLALQQGDLATALRWAQTASLGGLEDSLMHYEIPLLTRAKILLAQRTPVSLAQALVDLAQLIEEAEFTHNTIQLIEILAVQALVEAAQGQAELALATLHRAVLLAKPGHCIRIFVDLGPALAGLLYKLTKRNIEIEYLGEVLAAFLPSLSTTAPAQQVHFATQTNLIGPLTERESEILRYLQDALPNKAIARELNISALTVKKHTISLYQKLGVQSRQQAVARARALGILPQI